MSYPSRRQLHTLCRAANRLRIIDQQALDLTLILIPLLSRLDCPRKQSRLTSTSRSRSTSQSSKSNLLKSIAVQMSISAHAKLSTKYDEISINSRFIAKAESATGRPGTAILTYFIPTHILAPRPKGTKYFASNACSAGVPSHLSGWYSYGSWYIFGSIKTRLMDILTGV